MTTHSTQPKAPARATNILHAHGHTLNDTRHMTDAELLALPGFGKSCLDYVRALDWVEIEKSFPHLVTDLDTDRLENEQRFAKIPRHPNPPPKPKRSWRRLWHKATT
jgi:hypothetical protein